MSLKLPSLRTRLLRQFVLLALLPALAVFAATSALLVPSLIAQAEERNAELAMVVRDQVGLQLESRLRAVTVLAAAGRRIQLAGDSPSRSLSVLLAGDPFLQAIYLVDNDGRVVEAALSAAGGRFAEDAVGLDLSGQPYLIASRQRNEAVWSDTFMSTLTGQATVALAVPADTQTVVVELSLAALSKSVVDLAKSGTLVVILDRAGRVIAHPEARQALQQQSLFNLPIVESALGGKAGSARTQSDGSQPLQLSHALPVLPIGWVVLVSQPMVAVIAPLLELGGVIVGMLAATLWAAVWVGWRLARRTGREVTQLADGAEGVALGGGAPPELIFTNAEFNAVWTRLRELFKQLKLRDEQTRIAQQDLQAVLDAATQVAVIATELDGQVSVFNIGAQRMLGLRPSEVIGRLTPQAWHDEAEVSARVEDLSRKFGQVISGFDALVMEARHSGYEVRDWTYVHRDGRRFAVSLAVTAMRSPDGALKGFLGVAIDITERRRAEALELARRSADLANQAKSNFLSQMSHELRTPLNAILGYAQLLETDPTQPPTPQQRDRMQHIQRAGWHLVRLIDDVLDMARIESGNLRVSLGPVDLQTVFAQVTQLVVPQMQQYGVTLSVDVGRNGLANGLQVTADETRLVQVLVNLVSNAAKYNRPQGQVQLQCEAQGNAVVLRVVDTGRGMTAEQLSHLFEPFNRLGRETSAIQGTGIGLVVTRHLVGLMQGRLEVRSEEGVGTTATVTLPVLSSGSASLPAPPAPPAVQAVPAVPALPALPALLAHSASPVADHGQPARWHVLYIEDNEVNAHLMRAILRQRPEIELQICEDGRSGLAAAQAEPPNLILLDMHLPDIGGEDVMAALRADALLCRTPVVVVSADATRMQISAMQQLGVQAYLTKPLELAETLRVVDLFLGGGTASAPAPATEKGARG